MSNVLARKETQIGRETKEQEGSLWSFAGLFAGLRSKAGSVSSETEAGAGVELWEEGEVHADLVKASVVYFLW